MTMPLPAALLNSGVQLGLGLPEVEATVEPFPLGLLGAADAELKSITGFVVLVSEFGAVIQFRWGNPVPNDVTAPLAFGVRGDTEVAEIWVGEVLVGRATAMEALRALLKPGGSLPGGAVDAASAFFVEIPGMQCPAVRARAKRRLVASLGGAMVPVVELLGQQRMLGALSRRQAEWRSVLAEYQRLSAEGLEQFLVLVLAPDGRLPSKALAHRLKAIGDPRPVKLFLRIASKITSARERLLFEQALARLLSRLFKRWRGSTPTPPERELFVDSCGHVLVTAERMAFAQARLAGNATLPATVVGVELAYGDHAAPLQRPALDQAGGHRIRVALLSRWITRCASEFASDGMAPDAMWRLQHESNEVLEAVIAGAWTCDDLRGRPWNELVHLDWQAVKMAAPVLPQVSWACDMPAESASALTGVGVVLTAIASTADLIAEAYFMRNCLASSWAYLTELLAGRTRLFSIKGTGIRATLELRFSEEDGWCVAQICAVRNAPLAEELAESTSAEWQVIRQFVDLYRAMPPAEAHPAIALCPAT